ncbi:hypothetical protein [Luteolibacter luteus]|uniref:Uncharacterized protein n=1 Tax=Luteolibacter luteus TaxID=2728835 RepID=A0A858RKT2_9BACT|nr:hypothetical protein [Luteolibacter luteus]QJE96800.1 hypothetical protein HHL09_13745 [Luteolibacter luteus]
MTLLPRLLIPAMRSDVHGPGRQLLARALVSSLGRSMFSGQVTVIREDSRPLFKIPRRDVDEFTFTPPPPASHTRPEPPANLGRLGLLASMASLNLDPRQWVVIMDAASLVLRNIDHLIDPDFPGPHAPPEVDFYWAAGTDGQDASRGFWAVRGEHLPKVLALWEKLEEALPEGTSESAVWARVVSLLPLRKKRFEGGEVVSPEMSALNWEDVSHSAVVTIPDWPPEEQEQFLQALFFGTYFGDRTGLMLQILDA